MPMPTIYRHATKDWRAFLADAKDQMGLISDNSTYTAIDAVFQVFRCRLTVAQALEFADLLPAVAHALFLARYDSAAVPLPFADRATMTAEAKSVRPHHNLTPDNAIAAVAYALHRHTNPIDLARVLAAIGPEAEAFWHVDVADPSELARQIT